MMPGWIKLHRRMVEWEWFNKSEMVHIFIYLLLSANNNETNWRGIALLRGQVITGRRSISDATGLSEQTIRTCLRRLENSGEISQKSTNKFTIITICKYEDYQELQPANQPTTNQQLTNNQPQIKNKENKENKENTLIAGQIFSDVEQDVTVNEKWDEKYSAWKKDISVYRNYCREGYVRFVSDKEKIEELSKVFPDKDIIASLNKACKEYWSSEKGWMKKKQGKSLRINWSLTFDSAVRSPYNHVPKQIQSPTVYVSK